MVESEICIRKQGAMMLVHPAYAGRVSEDWFDAGFWGDDAGPVSSGGRGGAWFIGSGGDRLVLRQYLRGGWVARIARRGYVYTRESRVRSFSEFRLLHRLADMGLPAPAPVAAWYRKTCPVQYRAAIIVERLEDTTPLAELVPDLDSQGWANVGATIRQFHEARVMHADLNCFNVLVRGGECFLIDFDKSRIMSERAGDGWKVANLERFSRSLVKIGGEDARRRAWDSFMNGYNRGMAT
jgi:3-deoxy-D-manno-octulosonic acid kinase